MALRNIIEETIFKKTSIAPLITFRVLFGFMMAMSTIRFAYYGWIQELYITPQFYFTYLGFGWIKPLGGNGMYVLFFLVFLSAVGVMLGWFYRISIISFFLLFTYVELIDKTNYLNHYYFVSIVSFLLIFVPAERCFSIDTWKSPSIICHQVPAWTINVLKLQLGFVYFFAGIAKLNPDWLFHAMPLKLWLPSVAHTPIIGFLFNYEWSAYLFSWSGAIYDLTIVFFLLYARTRVLAYIAVVVFHIMTAMLFQIGMFPYIMILSTLIYFSPEFHQSLITKGQKLFGQKPKSTKRIYEMSRQKIILNVLAVFFTIQLLLPFRYLAYPGSLFWSEQGYRFSWRVMLMEKAGYTTFTIKDGHSEKKEWVNNMDFLTPQQEKMMSTQPDMILQYAHYLAAVYTKKGFQNPIVNCTSKVALNGKRSQLFIDPNVDLAKEERGFHHKKWIIPQSFEK